MVGEQRYFIASFGKKYADEHPVDGGCYPVPPSYCPAGISKGDWILLYCTGTYPRHNKETPGLGEVTHKEEREGHVFVYYKYKPLVPPKKRVAINDCLTEEEKRKFRRPDWKPNWLFEIKPTPFWCAVGEREVN